MRDSPASTIRNASAGGVSADHPPAETFEIVAAPSTEDQSNTIQLPLLAIACWGVDDIRFAFDSSFLSVDYDGDEFPPEDIRQELIGLKELVDAHPGCPLSLFGHADPVGSDVYNKGLSERRAKSVYALLIYKSEPQKAVQYWNQIASEENWGKNQKQTMQKFVSDAGSSSGGSLTNAYLAKLSQPGPLLKKTDFLGQGIDPDRKGDFQGCSEFNPLLIFSQSKQTIFEDAKKNNDEVGIADRNTQNAPNRRVLGLMFKKGSKVEPAKWPCPRAANGIADCKRQFWGGGPEGERRRSATFPDLDRTFEQKLDTFACRFYDRIARATPCGGSRPIIIRLLDIQYEPIAGKPYQLSVEDLNFSGITSDQGLIVHNVPADTVNGTLTYDDFTRDLTIDLLEPSSTVVGAQPRLLNLAFGTSDASPGVLDPGTQLSLLRCQKHHDLPTTGELDDPTSAKIREGYGS